MDKRRKGQEPARAAITKHRGMSVLNMEITSTPSRRLEVQDRGVSRVSLL